VAFCARPLYWAESAEKEHGGHIMDNVYRILAALILLIACKANATPILYEVDLVNTLGAGDYINGQGFIEWDASTQLMTHFEWDFLEGAQPGGQGNSLSEAWLTSAFDGGTYGAALWELTTGEDVFANPLTVVIALESEGAFSINGFPNYRAEFSPGGQFQFYNYFPDSEELVGEGTISIPPPVPEPVSIFLFSLGLASLGLVRLKQV
jgi:hypothetical protein